MDGTQRIACRVLEAGDWPMWRSLRLAALEEAPDAFGSTLSDWSGTGDTEERWRSRLEGVAHNVVAELDGDLVGMVSASAPDDGDVELLSMWVAPAARGKGVGDALVSHVHGWAREVGAKRVFLDVRSANPHAISLYERHGFVDAGPATGPGDPHPERRMVATLDPRAP